MNINSELLLCTASKQGGIFTRVWSVEHQTLGIIAESSKNVRDAWKEAVEFLDDLDGLDDTKDRSGPFVVGRLRDRVEALIRADSATGFKIGDPVSGPVKPTPPSFTASAAVPRELREQNPAKNGR